MGPKKKWHMHSQPKRSRDDQPQANSDSFGGGSGNGNGDASYQQQQQQQQPSKRARVSAMSLSNVKGHQAVVGTCDVRNDRHATAELVDLLNAFADELYPEGGQQEEGGEDENKGAIDAALAAPKAAALGLKGRASDSNNSAAPAAGTAADDGETKPASVLPPPLSGTPTPTAGPEKKPPLSVEEMVRQEVDALRSGTAKSHRFKSVNTSVRGVVMVCVMDPKIDALKLVDAVFEGIRSTRKRRCRFLERVTPMQVTAFSEIEAFKSAAEAVVLAALPQVAEGVPPIDAGKVAVAPTKANAVAAAAAAAAAVAAAAVAAAASAGKQSESEGSPPNKEGAAGEVGEGQTAASTPEVEAAAVAGEMATTPAADAAENKQAPNCAKSATRRSSAEASDPDAVNAAGTDAGDGSTRTTATTGRASDGSGAPSCADEEATAAGIAEKAEQAAGTTADEAAEAKTMAGAGRGARSEGSGEVAAKKTCDKRWKFRVDVRRRNSGLKRLDLINAVADSVGKGHSVSMSSPEVTIAVEAVKSVVGASVLFNYALNHEYSISRLQDAVCGSLLHD